MPKKSPWLCPVCGKVAGRGTFTCGACHPPQWVHYKCWGYSGQEIDDLVSKNTLLTCNNHKVCVKMIGMRMK